MVFCCRSSLLSLEITFVKNPAAGHSPLADFLIDSWKNQIRLRKRLLRLFLDINARISTFSNAQPPWRRLGYLKWLLLVFMSMFFHLQFSNTECYFPSKWLIHLLFTLKKGEKNQFDYRNNSSSCTISYTAPVNFEYCILAFILFPCPSCFYALPWSFPEMVPKCTTTLYSTTCCWLDFPLRQQQQQHCRPEESFPVKIMKVALFFSLLVFFRWLPFF